MKSQGQTGLLKGALLIGGTVVAYQIARKGLMGLRRVRAQTLADDSVEVRQAMAFRSAMNPSGFTFLRRLDFTDTAEVLETAKQVRDLDKVSRAYKDLYGDNLFEDLQSELSTVDYQKLLVLASSNPEKVQGAGSAAPVLFAKPRMLLVAKRDVYVRSSPDATNHGAIYERFSPKNIVRTAKPGDFIGYATGGQHYDTKNDVKFVQVGFSVLAQNAPEAWKGRNANKYTHWVSSSANYVEQFDDYARMWAKYPTTRAFTHWMKPLDYFERTKTP
ncbi:MAG: hypothetical protein ACOYOO_05860 [Saprospiraceae bacterium]